LTEGSTLNTQPEEYLRVRHHGDSEKFKNQCLERLIRFLAENADLTQASAPFSIQPELKEVKPRKKYICKKQKIEFDALKLIEEKTRKWAIDSIKMRNDIDHLLKLELEIFEIRLSDSNLYNPRAYIFIKTSNRSYLENAAAIFNEWNRAHIDPAINIQYPSYISEIELSLDEGTIKFPIWIGSKKRNRIYANDYFELIKKINFASRHKVRLLKIMG